MRREDNHNHNPSSYNVRETKTTTRREDNHNQSPYDDDKKGRQPQTLSLRRKNNGVDDKKKTDNSSPYDREIKTKTVTSITSTTATKTTSLRRSTRK